MKTWTRWTRCENGFWIGDKYVICNREGSTHIHFPRGKMWVCGQCFDDMTVLKKIQTKTIVIVA